MRFVGQRLWKIWCPLCTRTFCYKKIVSKVETPSSHPQPRLFSDTKAASQLAAVSKTPNKAAEPTAQALQSASPSASRPSETTALLVESLEVGPVNREVPSESSCIPIFEDIHILGYRAKLSEEQKKSGNFIGIGFERDDFLNRYKLAPTASISLLRSNLVKTQLWKDVTFEFNTKLNIWMDRQRADKKTIYITSTEEVGLEGSAFFLAAYMIKKMNIDPDEAISFIENHMGDFKIPESLSALLHDINNKSQQIHLANKQALKN